MRMAGSGKTARHAVPPVRDAGPPKLAPEPAPAPAPAPAQTPTSTSGRTGSGSGSGSELVSPALPELPVTPPGTPPPRRHKAARAEDCRQLEALPNIGPALAADLRRIGIHEPQALARCDGLTLYRALCTATGRRQDPCVLDTFLAICDFMRGAAAAPWWHYTARRKREIGEV